MIHLLRIDVSIFLQDLEDARDAPAFRVNDRVTIQRQNSRQIVDETTPGDVSEPFDYANGNPCQQRLIVLCTRSNSSPSVIVDPGKGELGLSRIFANKIFRASE